MSSQYEKGKKALQALYDWYKVNAGGRNEATTRLHLIDSLLFECLFWDKRTDCEVEERLGNRYSDYTFKCPRRVMIVEAKKEGVYFDIPIGFSNRRYKIQTLQDDVSELGNAISQVSDYCQKRGAPYGVVTNGHQVVAFIASRQDGQSPLEGDALVFESLEAMFQDFRTLWNVLSKPGVIERNLQKQLFQGDRPILPQKLSETLTQFPGLKDRNIIQTDLQLLADLVFEDIIGAQELEEQFLKECYCQSGALSQYALISKNLLSKRYDALFDTGEKHPTLTASTDKKGISKDLIAESFSRRPILLLGDVGVGKTMFFRHFINIDAKEVFKNALILYIDFGSKAAFTKDIRDFTLNEIQRQLLIDYGVDIVENNFVRGVYHGELIQFSKGIYSPLKETQPKQYAAKEIKFLEKKIQDKEQHCIAVFKHLTKAQLKQVIVFLDNADQRSDSIQQQVFIIAQSMASHWSVAVFLALRPETFHRSKERGSLSAYHLKAFTVAPPRIDQVLNKRLNFGIAITEGKVPLSALSPNIHIDLNKVRSFMKVVKYTFENSHEVVEAIDNLSSGNVRQALDFTKRLISSGHIDTKRILEIYEKTGHYLVRLHEFLRTIIFGDCIYYDPDISPVFNLFELVTSDPREHFLRLIVLQHVASEGRRSRRHGFVDISNLYDFLQGQGFVTTQIDACICSLWSAKLLETAGRVRPVDNNIEESAVRITTIGAYHLHRLPYLFVYYDAISTDLTILNDALRVEVTDVSDITQRLTRGEKVLEYLDNCSVHITEKDSGLNWLAMRKSTQKNIEDIRRTIGPKK